MQKSSIDTAITPLTPSEANLIGETVKRGDMSTSPIGCPTECKENCSPGYVCNCTGQSVIATVRKRKTDDREGFAFVREASGLMTTRLSLVSIHKSLVDFAEAGSHCCGCNCIKVLLDASDHVGREGGGYNRFPKAVLAARMSVYVKNQNKAADNLRNILAMCRNPTTNKTEYRFFHMGHLGDVDKGVPAGIPVSQYSFSEL